MTSQQYRILTPDGLLTVDTFVLAAQQPPSVKAGCTLVVHQQSGAAITVHKTRLFPADPMAAIEKPKSVCLKCGRVEGVIQDRVTCPEHGGIACGMVEPVEQR
jgi:hypothetical protein